MTTKQIKQNAEAYAGHFFGESLNADARDGYIAGAHSRDEEIKDLQLAYNNLVNSFNERGIELAKASQELNQLRNPWRSVKEQLPEKGQLVFVRATETIQGGDVCEEQVSFYVHSYNGWPFNWCKDTRIGGLIYSCISKVTHWMPIPELPKGGTQ